MSKEKSTQPFPLGTYARMIIQDWQSLSQFIIKHAKRLQEQHQSTSTETKNLQESQIDEVLNGPYHDLVQSYYHAISLLMFANYTIKVADDDTFKTVKLPENITQKTIPTKYLDQLTPQTLEQVRATLETRFQEHKQQWLECVEMWRTDISIHFTQCQITLSEDEMQTLVADEPISELLERFVERQLTMPKQKQPRYTFADYFHLKIIVITQSALSRQQLPHTQKDMDAVVKKFKGCLSEIKQKEKSLSKEQQAIIDDALQPIAFMKNYIDLA